MRLILSSFSLPLLLLASVASAQDASGVPKKSFGYQSDVARLRNIVINSLYSHRDVFLRELISNSNDALEKLRVTSLKAGDASTQPLNITIKAIPDTDGPGGRLVLTDHGIGMTPEELATNLGTLAKSGTSDFLAKVEKDAGNAGNLIGQFGVGFYSAFLVSDRVYVASLAGPTKENPDPIQHVFSSSAEDSEFEIYPDPRGNTLGRGTEITLVLKEDALEYLQEKKLRDLVTTHSAFATTHPIYLYTIKTEEVPDDTTPVTPPEEDLAEPTSPATATDDETVASSTSSAESSKATDIDEDEAVVEDVTEDEEKTTEDAVKEEVKVPMKNVTTEEWVHLNNQAPLWTREPKSVSKDEYDEFYRATFKDSNNPLTLHHFKGDAGSISFKSILFVPPTLEREFWQSPKALTNNVKLMVKRVFITSDFGEAGLPKWISWLRAIVDADDLPLNVSRETLQSTRFLRQIRQVLINRALSLLARISSEEPELYKKILDMYGPALKLGAVESAKERVKLVGLTRWTTNLRNFTSLDDYITNKKQGQTQIFFLAEAGGSTEKLARSVFAEKLTARGYEVILATEPVDEILIANMQQGWKGLTFQDASKKGLKFGDEEQSAEEEKAELEADKEKFEPLLKFLKEEAADAVKEVIISNRLVTSACAIVADKWGYSANMEKLMNAQTNTNSKRDGNEFMHEWARKQKTLEINAKSPLIQGLLKKVVELEDVEEGEEKDPELEKEVKEVVSILIDGALVRSGFEVEDSNLFFNRIDRVLRRSLGVSESAETEATVKPAPPVDESAAEGLGENNFYMSPEALDSDEKYTETGSSYATDTDTPGPVLHDEL